MVEEKKKAGPHNVVMEDRKRLTVTGVTEIDSFDEQTVVLFCDTGELAIRGEGLHINRIDVDAGELNLEGVLNIYKTQGGGIAWRSRSRGRPGYF